jgi:sulfonate transport system substrate-binding protein
MPHAISLKHFAAEPSHSRWLLPLLAASLVSAGCNRARTPEHATLLASNAPLPSEVPPDTTLRIGDPKVQKELELSGLIARLPFRVEWQNISGGPQMLEAFRAGALDAGSVGDTPPIHAAFTGLDVKIIAVQTRDKPSMQLAIAPGVRIDQLTELRGKKIAYAPGQAQGALVLRVLAKANLRREDVSLIELNSTEFKDALGSRQVDMAPLGGPGLQRYLKEHRGDGAHTIAHGTRDSISFLYVPRAVLQDRAKAAALRAYVHLRAEAQLWASEHAAAWQNYYYEKDQGLAPEDARAALEIDIGLHFPADWRDVIHLTQDTIDLLASATGRKSFDAQQLFDLRYQSAAGELLSAVQTESTKYADVARP